MSSGEADVTRYTSLDWFRRCEVDACPWRVHEPASRCADHGGPPVAQYATGSEGDFLDARHVTFTQDFDG